jgi:hypothetical protein
LHALDEGGVARDTVRFNEMLHLEDLLVDGRIRRRQPIEGARNLSVRSKSGGRCPSVSGKAKSGIAADAVTMEYTKLGRTGLDVSRIKLMPAAQSKKSWRSLKSRAPHRDF